MQPSKSTHFIHINNFSSSMQSTSCTVIKLLVTSGCKSPLHFVASWQRICLHVVASLLPFFSLQVCVCVCVHARACKMGSADIGLLCIEGRLWCHHVILNFAESQRLIQCKKKKGLANAHRVWLDMTLSAWKYCRGSLHEIKQDKLRVFVSTQQRECMYSCVRRPSAKDSTFVNSNEEWAGLGSKRTVAGSVKNEDRLNEGFYL